MLDSNSILEIMTIYRRMKKGRENRDIYRAHLNVGEGKNNLDEISTSGNSFYDFRKFTKINHKKFLFFNSTYGLIQSQDFFSLENVDSFLEGYYWLNVFAPSESDIKLLGEIYNINDITLDDIREGDTEEKIETYKHYTFMSLKIHNEFNDKGHDMDFNILLFKNCVLTIHNRPWTPILDILNFLYLISMHTTLYPEWVLCSVMMEFVQDVKYSIEEIEPEASYVEFDVKIPYCELTTALKKNFSTTYRAHHLYQFLKKKIGILSTFKIKYSKRLRKQISQYLQYSLTDLLTLEKELKECTRMLERIQDLYLALADLEHSKKENETNMILKKFSLITFILLPMQTFAGLFGMNLLVPWQHTKSIIPFWGLLFGSLTLSAILMAGFYVPRYLKEKKKSTTTKI